MINYDCESSDTYLLSSVGQPLGKTEIVVLDDLTWTQAYRYVLFHHKATETFRTECLRDLRRRFRHQRRKDHDYDNLLNECFHSWFSNHVLGGSNFSDEIRQLAQGPKKIAKRCNGFIINGYRFDTKDREKNRKTQNSGVVVTLSTKSYATTRDPNPLEGNVDYYGMLTDIIELNYYEKFKIMLFHCDWADVTSGKGIKNDKFGFTLVNFSQLIHIGEHLRHEPFVFSSQARQVFYSQDPYEKDWFVVLKNTPRDFFDMREVDNVEEIETYVDCSPFISQNLDDNFVDEEYAPNWIRLDVSSEDVYG
ncbi:hypothetical protein REPUB_Repub01dG0063200 [Reevesia pubescens]